MKIALINFEKDGGYLPLSTAYLASYLMKKGFNNIKIIDRFNITNFWGHTIPVLTNATNALIITESK